MCRLERFTVYIAMFLLALESPLLALAFFPLMLWVVNSDR